MIELRRGDPGYPERLARSKLAPDRLWVVGTLPPAGKKTVAIVGTRRMTDYGRRIARELASTLAASGVVIVSGLAQGIDSTAHQAALAVDGCTVAVLGEGLLSFESSGPIRRRRIAHAIVEHGALISEYAVELRGTYWTFPRRNATIAGLADVVVVVEAPEGSGALITAGYAIDLGRPLFAVPGPLGASTWVGSNRLVAERRAHLLTSADQIAARLGIEIAHRFERTPLPAAERLLEALAAGPSDADSLAQRLGTPASDVAMTIAELLIGGSLVATGDGRFARR